MPFSTELHVDLSSLVHGKPWPSCSSGRTCNRLVGTVGKPCSLGEGRSICGTKQFGITINTHTSTWMNLYWRIRSSTLCFVFLFLQSRKKHTRYAQSPGTPSSRPREPGNAPLIESPSLLLKLAWSPSKERKNKRGEHFLRLASGFLAQTVIRSFSFFFTSHHTLVFLLILADLFPVVVAVVVLVARSFFVLFCRHQ